MKRPSMIRAEKPRSFLWALARGLMVLFCSGFIFYGNALAAVGVNPPAGNPNDYTAGDWAGTASADDYTNDGVVGGDVNLDAGNDVFTNNGRVTGTVNGQNWHDRLVNSATGQIGVTMQGGNGNDTLINHGTVGKNLWGGNHDDTIENHGGVEEIYGGPGEDGITNYGTVTTNINGEEDNDNIINSGTVSQSILAGKGDDIVINHNRVDGSIQGGLGNDTITNNGSVTGHIVGDEGNDTITINGSVGGNVYGREGDDTIIINGRVDGDVACDQDNDWVILRAGAKVGGSIRGGLGTNTVTFDGVADAGAFDLTNFTKVEFSGDNGMSGVQGFTGPATITGTLRMQNGTFNSISISVNGGTLAGNGNVAGNVILMGGGKLAPGNSIGAISVKSVLVQAGTTYDVELSGAYADRLNVASDVNLSGGLNLILLSAPCRGYRFVIINKSGAGAVTGAFSGLAEGASFTAGGYDFSITYAGGDGNDVVLTALSGISPPSGDSPDPEPTPETPSPPDIPQGSGPCPTGSLNGPTLTWPHVVGSNFYRVYRAACPACPKQQVGRVTGLSFTDESARPGQVYYYFIRTENPGGLSDYSDWLPAWRYEQNPGRAGDFNGDGVMDLLWWDPDTGGLSIWYLKGGAVQSVGSPGAGLDIGQWLLVNTGDFNNDGVWDLLWWNPETGAAAIWYMTATASASGGMGLQAADQAGDITGNVTLSYSGDLNGDGRSDLVWRDYASGEVTLWLMGEDGKPSLSGPPSLAEGMTEDGRPGVSGSLEWTLRGAHDLDADGKADLVWQHATDGRVVVWLMDGARALGFREYRRDDAANWRVAGLGDLDGDGRGDLLWRNDADGRLRAWLMTGGAAYEERDIALSGGDAAAWQVKAVGSFCRPGCAEAYCKHAESGAARIVNLDGGEFDLAVE